jgi:hypothetical protein
MNLYFKLIAESMRKIWLRFSDPWWKNVTSLGVPILTKFVESHVKSKFFGQKSLYETVFNIL